MWLLPPSLDELLPQDHPARFVAEFVAALSKEDWSELGVDIDSDSMGAPANHPHALLSVWLYEFMTGVRSCRKLEVACLGSDTVPVADRVAAPGPQYPVAVLQSASAVHEEAIRADGKHGGND